ncbi:MAG TPA: SBBP repeat-containing protein [Terriglobales bacterium]
MKLNRPAPGKALSWTPGFLAIALLLAGFAVLWGGHGIRLTEASAWNGGERIWGGTPSTSTASAPPLRLVLGRAPLGFEPNLGQADSRVKYLARGSGYGLFLTDDEAVLALNGRSRQGQSRTSIVRMKLAGANAAAATASGELPGKSNYLIGNDPSRWRRGVPQFSRVRYAQVYPGIDLVYYGSQGRVEYDFEVAPGVSPGVVQLAFAGAKNVSLDATGDLIIAADGADLRLHAPVIYQELGTRRQVVQGKFALAGNRIGFEVGDYDRSRTLVIDPVLSYSSYLGGTGNEACAPPAPLTIVPGCPAVAVDTSFNMYVAGQTASADFPVTGSPLSSTLSGTTDLFVTKFDPTGSTRVFSTYLGGSGDEFTAGLAADAGQTVYVAGTTNSGNFPMASPANGFQTTPASSGNHAFVSALKSDGTALNYSTYLSGNGTDVATGMTIDNKGDVFVTGTTTSTDTAPGFPATAGAFQTTSLSANQFFVSKVDTVTSGSASLAYSTYFGGGNPVGGQAIGGGIAVDSTGNVYFTGGTNFRHVGQVDDFPILNAAQPCLDTPAVQTPPNPPPACSTSAANLDAFVAKLTPNAVAAQLLYSTYLGGTGADQGYGIAVDGGSNVYLTGTTTSPDIFHPAGTTPFQASINAGGDAFLVKLNNPAANALVSTTYSTYIGGGSLDVGLAVAVDSSTQIARVAGWTASPDLTGATGFGGGGADGFFARIDTTASTTVSPNDFTRFLGGNGADHATGLALDTNQLTYLTGDTASTNFPTAGSPFQASLAGGSGSDAFLTRLQSSSDLALTVTPALSPPTVIGAGHAQTFTYKVTNIGPDPTAGVTFVSTLPASGATFGTVTSSPGSCTGAVNGSVSCTIGTLGLTSPATVTLSLTATSATPLTSSGRVFTDPTISVDPVGANNFASTTVQVTDFGVSASPLSVTVSAGNPANYQVKVTPLPSYSSSVSLAVAAGLPQGASASFSSASVSIPGTSAVTSNLTITTTARPVTTSSRFGTGLWFALFLPLAGIALLAVDSGSKLPRRRKVLGCLLGVVLAGTLVQAACGGGSGATPPTNPGTPAGTYTVTIRGSSGVSRDTTVLLVVQ